MFLCIFKAVTQKLKILLKLFKYLAQRWNRLKSTLLKTSSDMWMCYTEFLYLCTVEFNLIQIRFLEQDGKIQFI